MLIHQAIDQAVARAVENQAALLAGRQQWNQLAGEVHDDEPLFEERATAFLEWLALDFRPSPEAPRAVVALLRETPENRENDNDATRPWLAALAASHRSVFRVARQAGDNVTLEDLWGGATFHVHERRKLSGMDPGEVFEARLVGDPDAPPRLVFTRAFCFHPREALLPIRKLAAQGQGRIARPSASGCSGCACAGSGIAMWRPTASTGLVSANTMSEQNRLIVV